MADVKPKHERKARKLLASLSYYDGANLDDPAHVIDAGKLALALALAEARAEERARCATSWTVDELCELPGVAERIEQLARESYDIWRREFTEHALAHERMRALGGAIDFIEQCKPPLAYNGAGIIRENLTLIQDELRERAGLPPLAEDEEAGRLDAERQLATERAAREEAERECAVLRLAAEEKEKSE